jgi:hypothetical protein
MATTPNFTTWLDRVHCHDERSCRVARQALRVTGGQEGMSWVDAVDLVSRFTPRGRRLRRYAHRDEMAGR